jgi:rod shape determining protein RodA
MEFPIREILRSNMDRLTIPLPRSERHLVPLVGFGWSMILISLTLAGIGLVAVFSATVASGQPGRSLVLRQVTWCSMGLVLMAASLLFDYDVLRRWAGWLYVAVVGALIAAWVVGKIAGGSQRWLEIGFMRFQPSEFAKLALVVILARYFADRGGRGNPEPRELILPILLTALPVGLVLVQPDLGTAGVMLLISLSMIAFAGVGRRALWWGAAVTVGIGVLIFLVGDHLMMEYQKKRLMTFLNPGDDPLGAGYHILQSQIAIGSGGVLGKGFLQGTQNQLMFLPVKHTDFVFSILAEEWGFIGCIAVLGLYLALFLCGLGVVGKARDRFGELTAFGCTVMLFWHVTVNVGMVMGLLPVVGVPLSFLSYGGSSLLAAFLAVAIMVNISMRRFSY